MKYNIRITRTVWQEAFVEVEADTSIEAAKIANRMYHEGDPSLVEFKDDEVVELEFECAGEIINDDLDDVKV